MAVIILYLSPVATTVRIAPSLFLPLSVSLSWSLALSLSVAGCLSGLLFARTFIRQTKVARRQNEKTTAKKLT